MLIVKIHFMGLANRQGLDQDVMRLACNKGMMQIARPVRDCTGTGSGPIFFEIRLLAVYLGERRGLP